MFVPKRKMVAKASFILFGDIWAFVKEKALSNEVSIKYILTTYS